MEYTVLIGRLTTAFYEAYPASVYPEILKKPDRPYTCLLIEMYQGNWLCIPFRSSIRHKDAFLFRNTERSMRTSSGLDYQKVVIIHDPAYMDTSGKVVMDTDEYVAANDNIDTILKEVQAYIAAYVHHVDGTHPLNIRQYNRHYQFSTLPYFHKELGLLQEQTEEQHV